MRCMPSLFSNELELQGVRGKMAYPRIGKMKRARKKIMAFGLGCLEMLGGRRWWLLIDQWK